MEIFLPWKVYFLPSLSLSLAKNISWIASLCIALNPLGQVSENYCPHQFLFEHSHTHSCQFIFCDCFQAMAALHSSDRNHMAYKIQNIYHLVLYRKSLLDSCAKCLNEVINERKIILATLMAKSDSARKIATEYWVIDYIHMPYSNFSKHLHNRFIIFSFLTPPHYLTRRVQDPAQEWQVS